MLYIIYYILYIIYHISYIIYHIPYTIILPQLPHSGERVGEKWGNLGFWELAGSGGKFGKVWES